KGNLLDVRGLTKGKGLSGPVKRFGITLKSHKSEKGRRNPGSIGPWHPAHVNFRVPMSGQLGMFTRVHYNLKVLDSGNISEKSFKDFNFRKYGKLTGNYIILEGSVQGPSRRQILVTAPIRPSKKQIKKDHEFLEMLK
ncbi:50S ribosomal protein L3, partial [Candidatus Parvarchaeota archaeon]